MGREKEASYPAMAIHICGEDPCVAAGEGGQNSCVHLDVILMCILVALFLLLIIQGFLLRGHGDQRRSC